MPMVTAYVAIGANLGDAVAAVTQAISAMDALPTCTVVKASGLYKTAPVETRPDQLGGGDYINAVVEVETRLAGHALLQHLQHLESAAGRERPYTNAPRTLDLDLLLYGDGCIDSADLVVPHPRMWQRAFVLVPLHEIAPRLVSNDALNAVRGQAISRL